MSTNCETIQDFMGNRNFVQCNQAENRELCIRQANGPEKRRPEWDALLGYLAAAVVVTATAVPVAAVVAAAVAEQQDQDDDPPPAVVVAHTPVIVAAHNRYLQRLFERRTVHVPWYSAPGKMCGSGKM